MEKNIDIKKVEKKTERKEVLPEKNKELIKRGTQVKNNKRILIFLISFLILLGLFLGGYFLIRKEVITPLNPNDKETRIIEFKQGESVNDIAEKLQNAGIIKNKFYFLLYIFKTQNTSKLQAGQYVFSPSMSIPQIAKKMVNGEIIPPEVAVTIPEGFRLSQIEEKVNKEFKRSKNEIKISDFKIKDFQEKYSFLNDAPEEKNLEGYLFPDTYLFPNKEGMADEEIAKEIVSRMLKNFNSKLTLKIREDIKKQKKTIFEIITMASILEKEVKTKEDKEIVSGIFWSRIKAGVPLESCATIAYILGKEKKQYSFEDTRVSSPYNTYLKKGLPEGPISNPGIQSIEAAVYPKETDYGYFLTDPKTGKTIFSRTLEEHNKNKVKYFKQ